MYLIKSFFIKAKNIQRKLQQSELVGKIKERKKCDIEKNKEIIDISLRYEDIINKKNIKIQQIENQHKKDLKAWRIYKEDAYILKKEYEEFRDLVKLVFSPVLESIQKVEEKNDLMNNLIRRLEKRNDKMDRLLN